MKADVFFLASDALEGRRSLQRGSEVAVRWGAAEFEKAGLKPAAGGSFIQKIPLIEYRTDRALTCLKLTRGGSAQEFRSPEAAGSFRDDAAVSGELVFAGFGITAPELGYDDYASIDARGRVVLVFDHEPQENDAKSVFNGKGNTRYAGAYVKALNAQRHGAAGLIVMPEPNRKHLSNQERMLRVPGSAMRMARMPGQALAESEVNIPAFTVGDKLAAELLAPAGKTPSELQSAIDAALKPVSLVLRDTRVELKIVNSERRRAFTYNVVGLLEGSDPALKGETVVLGGHYDHDGVLDDGVRPGADDNATGTAAVIELARVYAALPVKPKRALLFILFAAEERGLLGAYYYAANPLRPLATTRAVLNFDMIGRNEAPSEQTNGLIEIAPDTTNEFNLVGTNYSPDYRAAVERNNASTGLRISYKWDEEAALNVYFRSDQYPFALKDIPAVWWFTGFHPDYHQTGDNADRVNYTKMLKIVKLAYLTGLDFANTGKPPAFKP